MNGIDAMADMKQLSPEDITMILAGLIKVALAKREAVGLDADAITAEEQLSNRIKNGMLYIEDAE